MPVSSQAGIDEAVLVSQAREGDITAFSELVRRYEGKIFRLAQHITQNREDAEDVLQETFVKIWHSFSGYSAEKGRLFTWMINIARNLAIDKIRSKDFRNQNKNQELENNVTFIDEQTNTVYKPELLGIKELVATLRPEQKSILDLVYFKGYTHVEAADELGIPLGTIKTRLRMAIQQLRKHFN